MKSDCQLHNGDCLEYLKWLPENLIDLTVTSPPYDNLRSYNNSLEWGEHIWTGVLEQLYRVTKCGGVVVWIVGDATIKGSETGTSFRQALWAKQCGFNLHDMMIYSKGGQGATGSNLSYWQDFEYMFVFTKGKIKTFNPIEDRLNKHKPGEFVSSQGHRNVDGSVKGKRKIKRKEFGRRFNIWQIHESGTRVDHPAVFPLKLAEDHIRSWSNESDLVLDPFMGSGTTAIASLRLHRNFIGVEKELTYFDLAYKRVKEEMAALQNEE